MEQYQVIFLLGLCNYQAHSANLEVSVTVEHKEYNSQFPRAGVTEPAWVTELLGPTEFPVSTTKRPNFPQRIRETIKQVHNTINGLPKQVHTTINGIPVRINQIFEGIHKGAQNIITGPGGPRTTGKPIFLADTASLSKAITSPLDQLVQYFQRTNGFFFREDANQTVIQDTQNVTTSSY